MGESGGEEEEQREGGRTRQHGAIVASGAFRDWSTAKIAETIRSVWWRAAIKMEEWLLLLQ